jgi:hypothetical protein
MSENPDYMQSVIEKMMRAGWAEKTITQDQSSGNQFRGISWTKDGVVKLTTINVLILEIESISGRLSQNELIALRELARLHPPPSFRPSTPPPQPPKSPRF